jgi:hypothetical protein
VTGYWFLDAAEGYAIAPSLDAFLSNGTPPVLLTFGSMVRVNRGVRYAQRTELKFCPSLSFACLFCLCHSRSLTVCLTHCLSHALIASSRHQSLVDKSDAVKFVLDAVAELGLRAVVCYGWVRRVLCVLCNGGWRVTFESCLGLTTHNAACHCICA